MSIAKYQDSQSEPKGGPKDPMSDEAKAFDFLVFVGRFQPFHNGHLAVLRAGLAQAHHVLVLCGSAHQPRSVRNPWTVSEREQMIRSTLEEAEQQRLHVAPLMDALYNDDAWVKSVQTTIDALVTAHHDDPHRPPRIGLLGHSKDKSAYYPNLFPQWGAVEVANVDGISATPIREAILAVSSAHVETPPAALLGTLPASIRDQIREFCTTQGYRELCEEHAFVETYRQAWSAAPYDPTFVTVDAVVVQSGHLLMVERKARPGQGLMALPGGFVDQDETLMDACLRELREETQLQLPTEVLKRAITAQRVFDDPYRSARGRTITHAFYIDLAPAGALPEVRGGDDAKAAFWVPLADLESSVVFEDHYFIIQAMTGI